MNASSTVAPLLKKPRLPPKVPSQVTVRPAMPAGALELAFSLKEARPGMLDAGAGVGAAVVAVKAAVKRARAVETKLVFISGLLIYKWKWGWERMAERVAERVCLND